MTREQREIIEQCAKIVEEAELQIYMADVGMERRLMDSVSRSLSMAHKSLRLMVKKDTDAQVTRKPISRLLNEGIL